MPHLRTTNGVESSSENDSDRVGEALYKRLRNVLENDGVPDQEKSELLTDPSFMKLIAYYSERNFERG